MATVRGSIKWTVPISTTVDGVVLLANFLPPMARGFITPEEYTIWKESGEGIVSAGSKTKTQFEVEGSDTASPPEATVFILGSYISA